MTDPLNDSLRYAVGPLVVVIALAAAIVAHAMLPRYDWRSPAPDGRIVLLYDRWTGRFQRATFLETGKIQLSDVYVAP